MKDKKTLLVILGIIIVSALGYIWLLQSKVAKITLEAEVLDRQKQGLLLDLEKERVAALKLSAKYQLIQDKLKSTEEELVRIDADFKNAQRSIDELNSQVVILKTESSQARQKNDQLEIELQQVSQERGTLALKMGSVSELQKAIRDLKRDRQKLRQEVVRWAAPKPVLSRPKIKSPGLALKKTKTKQAQNNDTGNRGFLVKEGKGTHQSIVRIEVEPFIK